METTDKSKHRRLMTLLGNAGIDDETRHDLVRSWTDGRTESTRDLTQQELNDLVWKLENDFAFANNPKTTADALQLLRLKQKRSAVLAIATRVGLHDKESFKKFNAWMKKYSIHKKMLNKYTSPELDDLIRQMHKIEANFNKSAEKAFNKAWHQHHGIPETSKN